MKCVIRLWSMTLINGRSIVDWFRLAKTNIVMLVPNALTQNYDRIEIVAAYQIDWWALTDILYYIKFHYVTTGKFDCRQNFYPGRDVSTENLFLLSKNVISLYKMRQYKQHIFIYFTSVIQMF